MQTGYKNDLKALIEKKGIISRKIGQHKKNNQPIDNLISEVQCISIEIHKLKLKIKEEKDNAARNDKVDTITATVGINPSQFKPRELEEGLQEIHVNIAPSSDKWDQYIKQHANSSAYHSMSIKHVIEDTFGHTCYYLSAEDENHEIQGVLPLVELKSALFGHFLISIPFFNYGGILANNKIAENALFDAAQKIALKSGVSHIEYRHTFQNKEFKTRDDKITMLLQLPETSDLLWRTIGTKVRAQITKAQSFNMTTKTGKNQLINDFYFIFSRNMRDLGTPVYSKQFFINLISNYEDAHIVIIYHNSIPSSAAFLLGWRDTMEIPWASTLREYNHMNANMLLYWRVLGFSIEQGFKVFDFGRSNKDSGTYRFKKQWGAVPHQLYWHYWLKDSDSAPPKINPSNPKFRLIIYVWKRLPVWLTKLIGPKIVKYLP